MTIDKTDEWFDFYNSLTKIGLSMLAANIFENVEQYVTYLPLEKYDT